MGKKSLSQSQQLPQNAMILPNPNPSSNPNSKILRFDSILKKVKMIKEIYIIK